MAKEVKKDAKQAKAAKAAPAKKEEKKVVAKPAAKPAAKAAPAKKEEKKPAAKPAPKAAPAKKEEKKPAAKEISNKTYHISKRKEDGKWQVKFASGQKAIKLFDTQAEAIDYAKKLADNQEGSISIHKVDGKIRKQNYGK